MVYVGRVRRHFHVLTRPVDNALKMASGSYNVLVTKAGSQGLRLRPFDDRNGDEFFCDNGLVTRFNGGARSRPSNFGINCETKGSEEER